MHGTAAKSPSLNQRRVLTERAFGGGMASVDADIHHSWQRSRQLLPRPGTAAPVDAAFPHWQHTRLHAAAAPWLDELATLAADTGMVAALADAEGCLLWTASGRVMQRRAEQVHFVPGGHWDEGSVGTNALALALQLGRPASVFSAEHYLASVHDWVCYAAPITDAATGETLGILDLSTTWNRHTPLGLAAASGYAQRIAVGLPPLVLGTALQLRLMGEPQVWLGAKAIHLTPRQLEIVAVLALHPDGLDLARLHDALYGERGVTLATLKVEVSQLRQRLEGAIGSRPYRLLLPCQTDFLQVEDLLAQGQLAAAVKASRGPFLPRTESPMLLRWRTAFECRLAQALRACTDVPLRLSAGRVWPEAGA